MIMMLFDVIMLYWKLYIGIYEKVKRLVMVNWYKFLFKICLINDIFDDFVKLFCRGFWFGLYKFLWKEEREKRI